MNDETRTRPTTDRVVLRLPAVGAYLSVLRTTTAALASRLDFTLDAIEDLRIAVDEASALLLPHAAPASSMECVFELTDDGLLVAVTLPTTEPADIDRESFAWTVLHALVDSISCTNGSDQVTLTMLRTREAREVPP